jgi:putative glutamine amidotransferase
MPAAKRPRIAIVGRFAEHTTANRYSAVINARNLLELVWAAGGEPITLLPVEGSDWSERLAGFDGVLMPGGSDVNPELYGQKPASEHIYGVDPLQDSVDMALLDHVFAHDLPLFTICRGTQIANVNRGGTLVQHMDAPHRNDSPVLVYMHDVQLAQHAAELGVTSPSVHSSCYHHQEIANLGKNVEAIAFADSGNVEAVKYGDLTWGYGVQWHPEDNYEDERGQLELIQKFVAATAR